MEDKRIHRTWYEELTLFEQTLGLFCLVISFNYIPYLPALTAKYDNRIDKKKPFSISTPTDKHFLIGNINSIVRK